MEEAKNIIGKKDVKVVDGKYTPEILWSMGRIEGYNVSSDNKKIAYFLSYHSIEENKGHTVIHVMDSDGGNDKLLTESKYDENSPAWIKNGSKVAFISNESGSNQIWEMNPDGTERKQLSFFEKDIDSFQFSPDGKQILFISQAPYIYRPEKLYNGLDKTTGMMANDLMYKHWNQWLETVPHPFYASFDGNKMGDATDILAGTRFESPLLPFGGMEQLTWCEDSKIIAYTCKKKAGRDYTLSTDSDIFFYDTSAKQETNICKLPGDPDQNMGYDINPLFSPCGKYIAWLSMKTDGYESDKNRLYVMDLETKKKGDLTKDFDSDVNEFCWDPNSTDIFFTTVWHGRTMIYKITLEGKVTQLTEGDFDYVSISAVGNKIYSIRRSLVKSDDLFSIDINDNHEIKQLTFENDHIFNQLKLGKVEERWTKTVDGKELMSWVLYPPDFDPNKKYPALLMCMGGPQEACSQVWSYRWNFEFMVAQGYIMIMPNRRGCPGFGQEWKAEVSKDYGGLCMQDYFSSIDDLAKEPYVDKERLGCVGASFGGYSVYWLAGHHEKRFKVFLAHDGIFDFPSMYATTDELWFTNWDFGGSYWDKDNKAAQKSYTVDSPHLNVDKWDTPILCIHSDKDYRILVDEGQSAFACARLRGIEAWLLYYTEECHFVNQPQDSILWNRVFIKWLDKHLK